MDQIHLRELDAAQRQASLPPAVDEANIRIFPCNRCGACCRNVGNVALYAHLDRGDGVCLHLNINTNLCRIYETRPQICRIADMFSAFEEHLTWQEYVDLNLQSCDALRTQRRAPETPAN